MCWQLENYGKDLLPFQVTGNSVKFDVAIATKFIFNRYSLGYAFAVDPNRLAILSATVDGADLAWGLTQEIYLTKLNVVAMNLQVYIF
jgi:hypothetical protein